MTEQITLVSNDGVKFQTSIKLCQLSGLIERILQDYSPTEDIQLKSITSKALQRILEYSVHHDFTPPVPPKRPVMSKELKDHLSDEWDVDFITRLSEDDHQELILASNYLDMKSLLDTCLVKYACAFKEMTIEEAKISYGIDEEFTPEVEEKLKQEYYWALDVEPEENA